MVMLSETRTNGVTGIDHFLKPSLRGVPLSPMVTHPGFDTSRLLPWGNGGVVQGRENHGS